MLWDYVIGFEGNLFVWAIVFTSFAFIFYRLFENLCHANE